MAGFVANAVYGIVQLGTAEVLGINLDQSLLSPITGGASQINIYGAIEGASVFRPNALTGDPNHLGIELVIPLARADAALLAARARAPAEAAARARARVPAPRRAGDAVALRAARARRRAARARGALPAPAARRPSSCCRSARSPASLGDRPRGALAVLRAGAALARRHLGERHVDALRRLRLHPGRALVEPALRARPEQLLRLLRVRHRPDELRPALVLRRDARRDRASSGRRSSPPSSSTCSGGSGGCARSAARSARRGSGRSRGG